MTSCATPSTASSCGSNAWIPSWRIWKRGGRCPPGDPDAAGGARTAPTYEGGQLDGQSLRWEPGGRHGPTRVADATLSPTGAGGIVAKQPKLLTYAQWEALHQQKQAKAAERKAKRRQQWKNRTATQNYLRLTFSRMTHPGPVL